jgi:alpha-tubulin suppressor-like RCC1 family protein
MTPHRVRFAIALAALSGWFAPAALGAEAVQLPSGANDQGQLGIGSTSPWRDRPVNVVGLTSGVAEIETGNLHACALTTAGGVKCWGYNKEGEIGDGTTTLRRAPVDVVGLTSNVAHIYVGSDHSCALLVSGGVKCWGENSFGKVGVPTVPIVSTPAEVTGFSGPVVALDLDGWHSCALLATGMPPVQCWGWNGGFQLGHGGPYDHDDHSSPLTATKLPNDSAELELAVTSTCVLRSGGGVQCLGENLWGQLGAPGHDNEESLVDTIGLTSGVEQLSIGSVHGCAVLTGGSVRCWGLNNDAQLGAYRADDHTPRIVRHRHTPTLVPGLTSGIQTVAAGGIHSCALNGAGEILCWGGNSHGQLGNRDPNIVRAQPRYVLDFGATATRTTIASNRRPSRVGQVVTYTARVSPATSMGRVRFGDGRWAITRCFSVRVVSGVARCRVRYRNPGVHRIRAWYLGTPRLATSNSGILRQRVLP